MIELSQAQQVTDEAAGLLTYLATVGILGGVTFAATEGIGKLLKKGPSKQLICPKLRVALAIGPLAGLSAYGAGFLSTPGQGPWPWAFAGVMGLLGTFTAKGSVDLVKKVRGQ